MDSLTTPFRQILYRKRPENRRKRIFEPVEKIQESVGYPAGNVKARQEALGAMPVVLTRKGQTNCIRMSANPEERRTVLFQGKERPFLVYIVFHLSLIRPAVCQLNTGSGQNLIQAKALYRRWLDSIRQHNVPAIRSPLDITLRQCETTSLYL